MNVSNAENAGMVSQNIYSKIWIRKKYFNARTVEGCIPEVREFGAKYITYTQIFQS
jgi:hypothetical protein